MHGHKPFYCKYLDCERSLEGNGFPRRWNRQDHQKRVHHDSREDDTGSDKSTPEPQAEVRTKGKKSKKRKLENSIRDQTAAKRVQPQPDGPKEPNLAEYYGQNQQRLLTIVQQLQDPMGHDTKEMLKNAIGCLRTMGQAYQRIHPDSGQSPITV